MVIEIEIPDKETPQYSIKSLLIDIAVQLYQKEVYSLAKCARLSGLNRIEFQKILTQKGIHLNLDIQDFKHDLDTLRELNKSL